MLEGNPQSEMEIVPEPAETEGRLIHRDLSWLQFNERVLDEAKPGKGNPLLERMKFLAITATNLDEFFMIRFASLSRAISAFRRQHPGNNQGIRELVETRYCLLKNVAKFSVQQGKVLELLKKELKPAGIHIEKCGEPGSALFELSHSLFTEQVLPRLVPPEPFSPWKLPLLENLQLAAIFDKGSWFRLPRGLPTIYSGILPGTTDLCFFFLDELLAAHLGRTFNLGGRPLILRVTRDADFILDLEDDDTESIPDVVRSNLGSRERKGRVTRLQYAGRIPAHFMAGCLSHLKLLPGQVFPEFNTLCLHGIFSALNQIPSELAESEGLRYPPLKSKLPKIFQNPEKIFEKLQQSDCLLHHPYDSFDAFVSWIQASCEDPNVESIELSIYRMDALSPIIESLKKAAPTKKVRALIELRARFDESNNLRLSEELRKAGVEVAFGFGKLKMHAKVALVTRREGDTVKLYTHLSTGNYNATTARQYTDLAILTAHPEVGADARLFFDSVVKGQLPQGFKHLVSAPTRLHRRLLSLIAAETAAAQSGKKARIVAKVNALVDEAVIRALYRASEVGVQVELIVRGACSLVPGVSGLSSNIRVISVVDRFLEHSRIYYFEDSKSLYLSSADWMPRNFFSRLEIAFPVLDPKIYSFIEQVIIPTYLSDNVKARELTAAGTWKSRTPRSNHAPIRSQLVFEKLVREEYEVTPIA